MVKLRNYCLTCGCIVNFLCTFKLFSYSFVYSSTFSGETTNKDREIKKCMTEAYKKTDDEFLQEASKA